MIYTDGALRVAVGAFDVGQATNLLLLSVRAASHPDATKSDRDAVEGSRRTLLNTVESFRRTIEKAHE
jgi:hypothetical protein